MWPFRRQQKDEPAKANVPSEIQEYYQAEQRERMWVAWLLAFVTLVVTVGVVLGLFFGGRAIYRKVTHKTKPVATVNQPQPQTSSTKTTEPEDKSSDNSGSSKPNAQDNKSQSSQSADSTTSPTNNNATPTNQTTNGKGAITNTGPGETAAFGFIIAAVLGFGYYELRLHQKLN